MLCTLCSVHPIPHMYRVTQSPGTPCSAHPTTTNSSFCALRTPRILCSVHPIAVHPQLRAPPALRTLSSDTPHSAHPLAPFTPTPLPPVPRTPFSCPPPRSAPSPSRHTRTPTPPAAPHPRAAPSRSHPLSAARAPLGATRKWPPSQGLLGVVVLRPLLTRGVTRARTAPRTRVHRRATAPALQRPTRAASCTPKNPCAPSCTHANPPALKDTEQSGAHSWLHGQPRAREARRGAERGLRVGMGSPEPPRMAVTRRRAAQQLSAGCSGAAEEEEISAGTQSGQGQGRPRGAPPAAGSGHCGIRSLWGQAVGLNCGAGCWQATWDGGGEWGDPEGTGCFRSPEFIFCPHLCQTASGGSLTAPQPHRHPLCTF